MAGHACTRLCIAPCRPVCADIGDAMSFKCVSAAWLQRLLSLAQACAGFLASGEACAEAVLAMMRAEFEVSRLRPGGVRKVRGAGQHSVGRDSSRMGSWSQAQKIELVRLVREHSPCGAADWEVNFFIFCFVCFFTYIPPLCSSSAKKKGI